MVGDVMERIGELPPSRVESRRPWRRRLVGPLVGAGLLGGLVAVWLTSAMLPRTLQAAVMDGLTGARSVHMVIRGRGDDGRPRNGELWYVRGEGLRAESSEEVVVDDGRFQWAWRPQKAGEETTVIRQPTSKGRFAAQVFRLLTLPETAIDLKRSRAPELDRPVAASPCLAYLVSAPEPRPGSPSQIRPADPRPWRDVVLVDAEQRVREISSQRLVEGRWQTFSEVRITYDVTIPHERVAARLPAKAKLIDPDATFHGRYPLERALARIDRGGLVLAVHEVRPLTEGLGYFVVSSVRATPEFLREEPPRRRWVTADVELFDVACQPVAHQAFDSSNNFVGLAEARREGVQYVWWILLPREYFMKQGGKRIVVDLVPPEGRRKLDEPPGGVWIPLTARYLSERHRDANGIAETLLEWLRVPMAPNPARIDLQSAAAQTRRDLITMGYGSVRALYGVAPGAAHLPKAMRPLAHFDPTEISDVEFANAIRKGIEDFSALDEIVGPLDQAEPRGEGLNP